MRASVNSPVPGDAGLGDEPLEVRRLEVRDADRAGLALRHELREGAEGGYVLVALRQRPVDEEKVDVVEAETVE
jgi:hypothetical protein